jgi:hypothetical protein
MGLRRSLTLSAGSLSSRYGADGHSTTKTRFSSLSFSNEYRRNVNGKGKEMNDKPQMFRSQDSEKTLCLGENILETYDAVRIQEEPILKVSKSESSSQHLERMDRSSIELSIPKKKANRAYVVDPQVEYDEDSFEEIPKPPTENYHENADEEQLDVSAYLVPCDICARKFMSDRLVFRVSCRTSIE